MTTSWICGVQPIQFLLAASLQPTSAYSSSPIKLPSLILILLVEFKVNLKQGLKCQKSKKIWERILGMGSVAQGIFAALIQQGLPGKNTRLYLAGSPKGSNSHNSVVQLVSHTTVSGQCRDDHWGSRQIQVHWCDDIYQILEYINIKKYWNFLTDRLSTLRVSRVFLRSPLGFGISWDFYQWSNRSEERRVGKECRP